MINKNKFQQFYLQIKTI